MRAPQSGGVVGVLEELVVGELPPYVLPFCRRYQATPWRRNSSSTHELRAKHLRTQV